MKQSSICVIGEYVIVKWEEYVRAAYVITYGSIDMPKPSIK